jgi:hypothetical protein
VFFNFLLGGAFLKLRVLGVYLEKGGGWRWKHAPAGCTALEGEGACCTTGETCGR